MRTSAPREPVGEEQRVEDGIEDAIRDEVEVLAAGIEGRRHVVELGPRDERYLSGRHGAELDRDRALGLRARVGDVASVRGPDRRRDALVPARIEYLAARVRNVHPDELVAVVGDDDLVR